MKPKADALCASLQLWEDTKKYCLCRAKTLQYEYVLQEKNLRLGDSEHFSMSLSLGS